MIVAGKGGVGKTTVTAALARAAAGAGLQVLVVAVEPGTNLAALVGSPGPFDDRITVVAEDLGPAGTGSIRGRSISAGDALAEYLGDHGLSRLLGRLLRTGVLDVVAEVPGIEDLLVLGKVKQLERSGHYDLILLDAPAAGHAVTFLQAARGLADAVSVGPIANQAAEVLEMLADERRCRVVLVTLAEETPVSELVEVAFTIEDRVGVALGPIVVNALETDRAALAGAPSRLAGWRALAEDERAALTAAGAFRRERVSAQREQLDRLRSELPLAQLHLGFRYVAGLDPDDVESLAAELTDAIGAMR
jgi:hypothetical protein